MLENIMHIWYTVEKARRSKRNEKKTFFIIGVCHNWSCPERMFGGGVQRMLIPRRPRA